MATRGRKILMGCGAGCLGLLLLGVGGCVAFGVWISRPGDLLEPRSLMGPATAGYLEWTLSGEDPGTRQFADEILELNRSKGDPFEGLPPQFRRWIIDRRGKSDEEKLRKLLPMVLLWTLEPDPAGRGAGHLFSLSIERLGNRMSFTDFILGIVFRAARDLSFVLHGGERIFVLTDGDGPGAMFIHDQDVFFASDVETAKRAVERLQASRTREAVPSPEIAALFSALPDSALRGVLRNVDGSLEQVWSRLADTARGADADLWSAVSAVTVSGGFSGPTSFAGVLDLHVDDPEWARTRGADIVDRLRSGFRRAHLPLESETEIADDRVRIRFRLEDVPAFLEELD